MLIVYPKPDTIYDLGQKKPFTPFEVFRAQYPALSVFETWRIYYRLRRVSRVIDDQLFKG